MKDLFDIFLVEFLIFSLYPLGSGSGSTWTFFGSWIRIRKLIDADPEPYLTNVDPQRSCRTIERISLLVHELMSFIHFCLLVFSHYLFITGTDMSMKPHQLLVLVIGILPSFKKVFEFYNGSRFLGFPR